MVKMEVVMVRTVAKKVVPMGQAVHRHKSWAVGYMEEMVD
jgi:hypothetical protein